MGTALELKCKKFRAEFLPSHWPCLEVGASSLSSGTPVLPTPELWEIVGGVSNEILHYKVLREKQIWDIRGF